MAQDYSAVSYGPESRQYLDIWIASSPTPTPVYINAHANGGTTNMPGTIIMDLKAAGISVISWESLTAINTQEDAELGWSDAELMLEWIMDNAETYNFDITNLIIGGSSRGTILSWIIGHRPNPNVKGLYMYHALPDGIWAFPSWWYPPDEVNVDSPPIFFVYKFEPGTTNSHDPENAIIITDRYDALDISDRYTLVHSLVDTDNLDRYQFLVDFALSVISPLGIEEQELAEIVVFPNPANTILNISVNQEYQQIVIYNLLGQQLISSPFSGILDVSSLTPGSYFIELINNAGFKARGRFVKQ